MSFQGYKTLLRRQDIKEGDIGIFGFAVLAIF